jgi:NAD(P)-dependent dehydrogenase (short-subunit alcohol dehydrogenase family)
MDKKFNGQVVFMTAAAMGLGKTVSIRLATLGATVWVVDRDESALNILLAEAASQGLDVRGRAFDLLDQQALQAMIEHVVTTSGKIDILINNAGGSLHTPFRFLEQSDIDWKRVFDLNVFLAVQLTRLVLPVMIQKKYGRIINLGSKAGRYGSLFAGANYVASKGAIHALTLQWAQEFGPNGITCNAICPGAIMTPRVKGLLQERQSAEERQRILNEIPVRRHGEVEDIAETIVFLASKESGFVTGVLLDVNGGQAMST